MNNFLFFFISIVLSGIEPFLPFGSCLIAWTGVAGVRRKDWFALFALLFAGMIRDVLFVGRLGTASIILLFVWTLSTLASSRFDRTFLVATVTSLVGTIALSLVEEQLIWQAMMMTVTQAWVFLTLWERLSGGGSIRLRSV